MSLNLSSVLFEADTILNSLLSKYVSLKFIGFNQADENKPYYLLSSNTVTSGFYFKAKRLPQTGEIIHTLRIVPETSEINDLLENKEVKLLELTEENGNFLRCGFKTLKEPTPPNYEWVLLVTPNKQERTVIN